MSVNGSQPVSFLLTEAGKVVNYWSPKNTPSSWGDATRFGRNLADEWLSSCSIEDPALILPLIVADMGEIGGVEIGFLTRVGEIAALSLAARPVPMAA